jgi:hypothetical protein
MQKLRKQLRQTEAHQLQVNSDAVDGQFQLEAAQLENGRLRQRLDELQRYRAGLETENRFGGDGNKGKGGPRGAGERFQRERDLEGVVDALRRVVDKQRAELERRRKSAAAATKTPSEARKVTELQQKVESLLEQNRQLNRQLTTTSDASKRAGMVNEKAARTQRQLRAAQEEVKAMRVRHEETESQKVCVCVCMCVCVSVCACVRV